MNLFQRLAHYLFGWHYLQYTNTAGSYVRRVKRAPNGRTYFQWYSFTEIKFLDEKLGAYERVKPLTYTTDWDSELKELTR